MSFDGTHRDRARELLLFCDGIDDLGFFELSRRSRVVAQDALRLADELDAERSTRKAVQEQRDQGLEILARQAGVAAHDNAPRVTRSLF